MLDQLQLRFRCLDSSFGFLLEGVQDVDRLPDSDGVDGPISVAIEVLDDLDDIGAMEALERLGIGSLAAKLRKQQRFTNRPLDSRREFTEVFPAGSYPCGPA